TYMYVCKKIIGDNFTSLTQFPYISHSCSKTLYSNESRQPSLINKSSRILPSFVIPTFSKTFDDPIFLGSHVANIRWRFNCLNPKSINRVATSVAIPFPQKSG